MGIGHYLLMEVLVLVLFLLTLLLHRRFFKGCHLSNRQLWMFVFLGLALIFCPWLLWTLDIYLKSGGPT